MPSFFIDRPIFAWVVAILISLGGVLAILNMGVESYPSIAPPSVTVSATYPGANADNNAKTVSPKIEEQQTSIAHVV
jgi:multidrug efflux pump